MPFIPNTPESHLARSDSKNVDTTCRGVTGSGRPCRRAIAATSGGATKLRHGSNGSLGSLLTPDSFCWQHKDQVDVSDGNVQPQLHNSTIQERTSIDTLAERLGLLEVEPDQEKKNQRRKLKPAAVAVDNGASQTYSEKPSQPRPRPSQAQPAPRPRPQKQPMSIFCCIGLPESDYSAPRPSRNKQRSQASNSKPPRQPKQTPARPPLEGTHLNPINLEEEVLITSQTQALLSLIPNDASPQTTSALLVELSKPVSSADEEGYIYIFWLTPESFQKSPAEETAKGLLEVPDRSDKGRRTSEVLRSYSTATERTCGINGSAKEDKILLKIGRASNVQRRLNEWKRQCGYDISLIRYYPYVPSSPSPTPAVCSGAASRRASLSPRSPGQPRKVPYANKVERLIHLELGGMKTDTGKCDACGREHREWFEVRASRKAVKSVDEVVRRWVDWSLREHGGD